MRAITFLAGVRGAPEMVDYVVDVNPHRHGRFLPCTGTKVIAPEQLRQLRPDVVIATNPNYAKEIWRDVQAMELNCEFEQLAGSDG